jgi:nitrate reductase molybdenum cofactor assembly chaperone
MTVEGWDRLADSLEYPRDASGAVQDRYVEAFDMEPASTLDVGWHLFGDRPERGQFLAMLRDDLARAGVPERDNLPDHLPTLLRLIARQDAGDAAALAGVIAPAVERICARLHAQDSPFAAALDAVAGALEFRRSEATP